jgi:Protein of unknown function (DUF3293)
MKEGAWINSKTGKFEWVDEHALFMQKGQGKALGLPDSVYEKIKDMHWDFNGVGREEILATVMKAGFIRMRGHGNYWTFEFTISSGDALWSCLEFLMSYAGPFTLCRFNNLRTGETIEMPYSEFAKEMEESPERVLRVAKVMSSEQYSRKNHFAAGYSRLMRIVKGLVPKVSTFGIISAENPMNKTLSAEENNKLMSRMKTVLKSSHGGFIQHKGHYGAFENPFFIMNIPKAELLHLGKMFDQETVIFGEVDQSEPSVTFELIEGFTVISTRKTVITNVNEDEQMYSEYKGRKFRIPFFDDEVGSAVIASNVPKGEPSLMPDEVDDPSNEPHLARIAEVADKLERYTKGTLGGGLTILGTVGSNLESLRKLKIS